MFPSIWFFSPSGLMMSPQSCDSTKRFTPTLPVDLSTSTSATAPQIVSARLEIAKPRPVAFDGVDAAFVAAQVTQPKLNRVDALVCGDLIDERFTGEAASDVARRAQITRAKRCLVGLHPRDQRRGALLVFEHIHLAATPGAVGISIRRRFHTDLARSE